MAGIVVGCLYLPNGNGPAPKFDYKLAWFKRLTAYAEQLLRMGLPAVLAGDYNVVPTDLDAVEPRRWVYDAVFQPQSKQAYATLLKQGWTDAIRHLHPQEPVSPTGTFITAGPIGNRGFAWIICSSARSSYRN